MPGLNNFRNGAAPTPAPTPAPTFSGSYATTAQDARDKCQGNVVASVTRSFTSSVSLVDAIQKARQLAIDAIVCPVFTGSYATTMADAQAKCQGNNVASITRSATSSISLADAIQKARQLAIDALVCPIFTGSYQTTPEDYQAKCGAGTSGASVQRSSTSSVSLAVAIEQAKQLALDAIVCPVPFPNYSTILKLTVPNDPAGEVTLTLGDKYQDGVFKFNVNPGGDSTAKSMIVNIGSDFACLLDFPATYTNTPTGWTFEGGGHRYTGTFVDGTTAANFYD